MVIIKAISRSFVNLREDSVFDFVTPIRAKDNKILGYSVIIEAHCYSLRYKTWMLVSVGDKTDGATCAPDIDSFAWLFHDELCATGEFYDGARCTNLQASTVLYDILRAEGKWFRKYTWFVATWCFGGGKARDNGML